MVHGASRKVLLLMSCFSLSIPIHMDMKTSVNGDGVRGREKPHVHIDDISGDREYTSITLSFSSIEQLKQHVEAIQYWLEDEDDAS